MILDAFFEEFGIKKENDKNFDITIRRSTGKLERYSIAYFFLYNSWVSILLYLLARTFDILFFKILQSLISKKIKFPVFLFSI